MRNSADPTRRRGRQVREGMVSARCSPPARFLLLPEGFSGTFAPVRRGFRRISSLTHGKTTKRRLMDEGLLAAAAVGRKGVHRLYRRHNGTFARSASPMRAWPPDGWPYACIGMWRRAG
jgi:hypothetical protein